MARPNILYVVCHDLGKHLGCYGAMVESPNLDAFAAEGAKFNRAFCNSPACSPSRACAMTGKYARATGAIGLSHMGWPLRMEERTIVDCLNDAGYETILSGVNHERHPNSDRYQKDLTRHWRDWHAGRAIDNALDYLRNRDGSQPFYLNIGTQQVHASAWHLADELYGGAVPPEDVYIPSYLPDSPVLRRQFGKFQAAIRYIDREFGRLLGELEKLGLAENTLVVFTTDHGISAMRSKGTLYDRGVEITLLMRLPGGRAAGTEVSHLIQNIDFAPTLLESSGTPVPPDMLGRSFWPLLAGQPYQPHEHIYTERNFHGEKKDRFTKGFEDKYDPVRAVRTPDFHYIKWFDPETKKRPWLPFEISAGYAGEDEDLDRAWPELTEDRKEEELYHVRHDPAEFRDVAGQPEYRRVKEDLARKLREWMESTDDFALRGEKPRRPEPPGWGPWEDLG